MKIRIGDVRTGHCSPESSYCTGPVNSFTRPGAFPKRRARTEVTPQLCFAFSLSFATASIR